MKISINTHTAIIDLDYVGLPLTGEFGKQFDSLGFDINTLRIEDLLTGRDRTLKTSFEESAQTTRLRLQP